MECEIIDGVLTISIPMNDDREPSTSGKTLSVASSHGNVKTSCVDPATGKPITVGLNAYVSAKGANVSKKGKK